MPRRRELRRLAPGVTDLPIDQSSTRLRPTAMNWRTLDDLGAAAARRTVRVERLARAATPLSPMARLDAAEARLQAMQAVDVVREPLQRLDVLLSDRQGSALMRSAMAVVGRAPAGGDIVALCSEQWAMFVVRSSAWNRCCKRRRRRDAFEARGRSRRTPPRSCKVPTGRRGAQTCCARFDAGRDTASHHRRRDGRRPAEAAELLLLAEIINREGRSSTSSTTPPIRLPSKGRAADSNSVDSGTPAYSRESENPRFKYGSPLFRGTSGARFYCRASLACVGVACAPPRR